MQCHAICYDTDLVEFIYSHCTLSHANSLLKYIFNYRLLMLLLVVSIQASEAVVMSVICIKAALPPAEVTLALRLICTVQFWEKWKL